MTRKALPLSLVFCLLAAAALTAPIALAGVDPAPQKASAKPLRMKSPKVQSKVALGDTEESVVRILRTTNKAQTNRYVSETLEFKNVNPFEIVNFFWNVVKKEEGGLYSFAGPYNAKGEITSGQLVVICPEYQLDSLRALARELDVPKITSARGSKRIYYRMKHRNISDDNFRAVVGNYMTAFGSLRPDMETNSVLIMDSPSGALSAQATLESLLDKPLRQVEMAVKIYEIDQNDDGTIGLDGGAWNDGPGKNLGVIQYNGGRISAAEIGSGSFDAHAKGIYLDIPSQYIDMLVDEGKAKTLIDTKIVSTSGHQQPAGIPLIPGVTWAPKATLTAGEEMLIFNTVNRPSVPDRSVYAQITSSTALAFHMTPIVGSETINLDTVLSVRSQSGYDGNGFPIFSDQDRAASIAVPNGEEVMLGGLSCTQVIKEVSSLPILGKIPLLGWLLGGDQTINKKSVIVVSVSATIVGEASNVTGSDSNIASGVTAETVTVFPNAE